MTGIKIDEALESFWANNLNPANAELERLKKYISLHSAHFRKGQKYNAALTECMLLRTLDRQTEAEELSAKHKKAFNRLADDKYAHRWKRLQLIEKVRLQNSSGTRIEAKQLADEAANHAWPVEQMRALFLLHLTEIQAGLFKPAIETVQQVRLLASENNDELYILKTAFAVAHTCYLFGHASDALKKCLKVKHLFSKGYHYPQHIDFYLLLGVCYQTDKQYTKSSEIFKGILNYLTENKIDNPSIYLTAQSNLATAYMDLGNLTESEKSYLNIELIARKSNWPSYQLNAVIYLARIYRHTGKLNKMNAAINRAVSLNRQLKIAREDVRIAELKFDYFKELGKPAEALKWHENYHQKFEEWTKLDNTETLKAIEMKHELQMQELNTEVMKKEILFNEQEMHMLNSHLGQKDKLIKQFADYFRELEQSNVRRKEIFTKLREMVHDVKNVQQTEMVGYSAKFNQTHQNAVKQLTKKYPSISGKEGETAGMLTQGLNNKEISTLTLTTIRNIEKHRLSLRKKMEIGRTGDLVNKLREAIK